MDNEIIKKDNLFVVTTVVIIILLSTIFVILFHNITNSKSLFMMIISKTSNQNINQINYWNKSLLEDNELLEQEIIINDNQLEINDLSQEVKKIVNVISNKDLIYNINKEIKNNNFSITKENRTKKHNISFTKQQINNILKEQNKNIINSYYDGDLSFTFYVQGFNNVVKTEITYKTYKIMFEDQKITFFDNTNNNVYLITKYELVITNNNIKFDSFIRKNNQDNNQKLQATLTIKNN